MKSMICITYTANYTTNYTLLTLGNVHKILMKKTVFQFVGIRKVKFFEFGSMESKKGNQGKKLAKVQKYFETHGQPLGCI
jgi:NAD(P)H dehydrogenase (quinone)